MGGRYNVDGSNPTFLAHRWGKGMPNNAAGAENCVQVRPSLLVLVVVRVVVVSGSGWWWPIFGYRTRVGGV